MTQVTFELRAEDLLIELWPPVPTNGMTTGEMPSGVKVTHKPSGKWEVWDVCRNPHQNLALAIEALTRRVFGLGRLDWHDWATFVGDSVGHQACTLPAATNNASTCSAVSPSVTRAASIPFASRRK